MKSRTQNVILSLGILLAAVFVSVGIITFNNSVSKELSEAAHDTLPVTVKQQQMSINRTIEDKLSIIGTIAEVLPNFGLAYSEAIYGYLETLKLEHNYSEISVVTKSGAGIKSDAESVDISNTDYFATAISGLTEASDLYVKPGTETPIITVSTPIYLNGVIDGVLAVDYTLEHLREILISLTNETGYALVVDSSGVPIMSTTEHLISHEDFMKLEYTDGFSYDGMLIDFRSGTSGETKYIMDGTVRLAAYAPINANGWMLFYVVPEADVLRNSADLEDNLLVFSAVILVYFAVFILYILVSRRKSVQAIEKIAYYDELTGLRNLVKFKADVEDILKKNQDKEFAIVKMDVDNFKAINEMFSFEVGNEVLKAFATTSGSVSEEHYLMGRVSGDEFMMFGEKSLLGQLEILRLHYEEFFKQAVPSLGKHHLTFSYGRYFIEKGETDVNAIVNKTTMAHRYAKSSGGEVIFDYDDNLKQQIILHTDIKNKMEDALENGEFVPYLQPKFSVHNNGLVGAEALVRWIEPNGKMIFPDVFIPLFESNGFIINLDLYILECVAKRIKAWLDMGETPVPVSVNFSRIHLKNPTFVSDIKVVVEKCGIPTKYIEVELTETSITENERELVRLLDEMHGAGFSVSIDDFGAGYSSLGMLKNFRVDTLKLDRSFFINQMDDERGDLVIDGIIKLAHSLDMTIVAEGIEESEQIDFLKSVNCEVAQGYYYAKPMPVADFEEKYLNRKMNTI